MSLFKFRSLRKFFRRHTNPIPVDRAAFWKQRLSIIYAIVAWNAFGLVAYMMYNGKADWAKYYGVKSEEDIASPGLQWVKFLGISNAQVYRVKGLSIVEVNEEVGENATVKND